MKYQSVEPMPMFDERLCIKTVPCPGCNQSTTLIVNRNDFVEAINGALIQKAFPHMSSTDRELLITGYCGDCWDKLFEDYD